MGEGLGEVGGLDLQGPGQLEAGVSPEPRVGVDLVPSDGAARHPLEYLFDKGGPAKLEPPEARPFALPRSAAAGFLM